MTMRRFMLAGALLAGTGSAAQEPTRPALWLVPKADTVLVYLTETPASGGFVVYRTAPAGTRAKRTSEPIVAVRPPAFAAGILGSDLPAVMRAMRAVDEGEMLRRLRNDQFAGNVLTFLFRGVAVVLGRVYADTGVTRGAEYQYQVVFTGPDGAETDSTVNARVRVADVVPPAPTQLRAATVDRMTRLSWAFPRYAGNSGDLVLGFHVYRAEGQAAFRRLTATPVIRNDAVPFEYRDEAVTEGVAYRYQMTAVDVAGRESAPTAPVSFLVRDMVPPAIPSELAVREGDGVIFVTWRLGAEADLVGYHVERSTGLNETYRRLNRALVSAQQPTWTDTVPGGRQFFYRVIAVDVSGNASARSNALAAVALDRTPPAPPGNVTGTIVARRLTVRWTASPTQGVRGYWIYRGDAEDRLVRLLSEPVIGTQFVDSGYGGRGLRPGASYLFEVSAVDSSFNESPKVRATITLADDEAPTPPTALQVRNVLGRYAEIRWTGSGALDVKTYDLTRATGDSAAVLLGQFPANQRAYSDTAVVRGRRYTFSITAVDSAGNRSPALMDTLTFRDFTPPPAPRAASARTVPGGIELSWERVVAQELVGYHVYRSDLPTGVFQRLTTTPLTQLTFTDPAGRPGLFYIVRAIDRSGNESAKSPAAEVRNP